MRGRAAKCFALVLLAAAGAAFAAALGSGGTMTSLLTTSGTTTTVPNPPPLFGQYQIYPTGSSPKAVAIGDVSGDGRADVVMTTWYNVDPVNDFRLFVFVQNADGTLAPPVSYATAGSYVNSPASVAVGDITGDGRNDVVLGVDHVGVQVFPQLQNGTLGSPTTTPTTDCAKIRLGNLNGDSRLDVAGIGQGTDTVAVLLNNGNGGLAAPVTYAAQHDGFDDLEVGDVTGDSRDDVVVMSGQGLVPNISVLPQLQTGGFGQAASYSLGGNALTDGIGVGDVNGDGRKDVVATDVFNDRFAVFLQTSLGTLGPPVFYATTTGAEPAEVADFDGDGRQDVLVSDDGGAMEVHRQQANGTLGAGEVFSGPYATRFDPHGIAVGDVNGDGSSDIAGANYNYGLVVWRNTSPPAGATAPGAPTLTAAVPQPGAVTLEWTPPSSDGGSGISGFRIYRGTSPGAETYLATVSQSYATTYTDHVSAGTTYYYEVTAVNAVGESGPSNELSAAALYATAPGAPKLTEANKGYNEVFLDWDAPASNGGTDILSYRIYRGTASGAEALIRSVPAQNTYFDDGQVVGGTTYYYEVSAVNSVGESVLSNELYATPLTPTVPDAPTLTAATGGYGKVSLVWKPGFNGGTAITGYKLYRGTTSGGETLLATLGNVTTYDDTSGDFGTTYFYELKATNSAGDSGLSNELSAAPVAPTTPGAPTLSVTSGFAGVSLSWTAPSNGGAAIGGYNVYRGTASGAETLLTTLGSVTSYTDTSGVDGTTYYYEVAAFNSLGTGALSNEVSATSVHPLFAAYQAYAVASSPQAVAIGDVTGDGRNDVVMASAVFGGNPSVLLVYAQRADGTLAPPVSYPTATAASSVAVGDITGDGRADVVLGLSSTGVQVFPQLASGTLGTPTLTPYTGTGLIRLGQLDGDGRLDVASVSSTIAVFLNDGKGGLKPPVTYAAQGRDIEVADVTNDGRDDIVTLDGNNVDVLPQLSVGGFGPAAVYPTGANIFGTNGLGVGDVTGDGKTDVVVTYGGNRPNSFIAVLAQRADGTLGPASSYPSYDIPEPVETGDFNLDGRVDVLPVHGGWNAAGVYRQRADGSLSAEELYSIPYASHYPLLGLAVGDFTGDGSPDVVLADYNNGLVVLRNSIAPTNVPGAPALTGATADRTAVNLTWTPPHAAGGSPSGYRIYRGTAPGAETLLATIGTATSFADNTAVPGTTYWYQVSAANSRGEGARSGERSASIAVQDGTPPTAPASLKSLVAGTNQVALDWAPSSDNVGVTGYRVYRNSVLVATVATTQYLDSGLAAATGYTYSVRALDAAGNASAASSNLTVKTASQSTSKTGTLAGVVFDSTGKPLANAVVTTGSKTAKTNGSGVWQLTNLAPATYSFSVALTGYQGQTFSLAAVAGKTVLGTVTLTT
jgi:fibronectin type 3 domain-containing protein